MPYKTIENARANSREWYREHRQRVLARLRERSPEERARLNARRRGAFAADPDARSKARQYTREYRSRPGIRDRQNEANRRYVASAKGQVLQVKKKLAKFNLTVEQYDQMLLVQGGVCAICKQPETHRHRGTGVVVSLAVDHDHRCCPGRRSCGNCVRGLLCDRCNLGRWPDDPALLRAAADYFERHMAT
jgi:hypothetical protein